MLEKKKEKKKKKKKKEKNENENFLIRFKIFFGEKFQNGRFQLDHGQQNLFSALLCKTERKKIILPMQFNTKTGLRKNGLLQSKMKFIGLNEIKNFERKFKFGFVQTKLEITKQIQKRNHFVVRFKL